MATLKLAIANLFARWTAKKKYHPLWYLPNGCGLILNLSFITLYTKL